MQGHNLIWLKSRLLSGEFWVRCPVTLPIRPFSYSGESARLLSGEAWFDSTMGRQTIHRGVAGVTAWLSTKYSGDRNPNGVPIRVLNSISRDWPFKPWDVGAIPTGFTNDVAELTSVGGGL